MIPGAAGALSALARFPLNTGEIMDEEPLYVNAKQYHRILKRRQARAKLEAQGRIPKTRQVRAAVSNSVCVCVLMSINGSMKLITNLPTQGITFVVNFFKADSFACRRRYKNNG